MHPITGSKKNVLTAIKNAQQAFADNNSVVQTQMAQTYPNPVQREQTRQQIVAKLGQAYQEASQTTTDPRWFTAQTAMSGIAQSAMNTRAQQAQPMTAAAAAAAAPAAALALAPLEQFGPLDPRWIEAVVDGFKTDIEGKAPFVQHKNLNDFLQNIPDQVTVAIFGDWGANNRAAQLVSEQIRAAQPDIVIHLGDIYYAGQENEAESALKMWPLADPATGSIPSGTSYAMNGNHEMYSGGRAYFGTILKALNQKASYFGLRNSNWQILAFDSSYVDQRLLSPQDAAPIDSRLASQWEWLVDKMKNSTLATILLSHHQPVSAFALDNNQAQTFRQDFQKFIAAAGRSVFGWFFGHEHRCTIFDDIQIPYLARLIGHGCIPHTPPPANQQPDPGCFSFSAMNTRANANGDAVSGFALLKFDGRNIDIKYIDEDGKTFLQEGWVAPLPN